MTTNNVPAEALPMAEDTGWGATPAGRAPTSGQAPVVPS
ncbi:hypothetical protein SAVIM338S_03298 [Streptomyces avidinii]